VISVKKTWSIIMIIVFSSRTIWMVLLLVKEYKKTSSHNLGSSRVRRYLWTWRWTTTRHLVKAKLATEGSIWAEGSIIEHLTTRDGPSRLMQRGSNLFINGLFRPLISLVLQSITRAEPKVCKEPPFTKFNHLRPL